MLAVYHLSLSYRLTLWYFLLQQNICLEAGYALSLFAYNNTSQQTAILKTGGVPLAAYESFLDSDNEIERAKAAFQVLTQLVYKPVISVLDHITSVTSVSLQPICFLLFCQTVVLAKVITDSDHVTLSARGVTILSKLLQSDSADTVVLTGKKKHVLTVMCCHLISQ